VGWLLVSVESTAHGFVVIDNEQDSEILTFHPIFHLTSGAWPARSEAGCSGLVSWPNAAAQRDGDVRGTASHFMAKRCRALHERLHGDWS